jgi:two-component sensor histidine kinase
VSIARIFAEATRLVDDAMLLTSPAGEVAAANRAAAAEFGFDLDRGPVHLGDVLTARDGEAPVDFLRRCSGSTEPLIGTLVRKPTPDHTARAYRCDGALFRNNADTPPLLQLRLRPKDEATRSFALLTHQIAELNREISARKQFQADLADALEARTLLVQELQHRVRNNLQLVLSLLRREIRLRRDGHTGAAGLQALAMRIDALGFVQKQVAIATDISNVALDRLVTDIASSLVGGAAGQAAMNIEVDIEQVTLPVPLANPLALLLTECLDAVRRSGSPGQRIRIQGRRVESSGIFTLTIAAGGALTTVEGLPGDAFLRLLAAQMRSSLTVHETDGMVRAEIKIPLPDAG